MKWNTMCSDCHFTNLYQNYVAKIRLFSYNLVGINVSYEARHARGNDMCAISVHYICESRVENG